MQPLLKKQQIISCIVFLFCCFFVNQTQAQINEDQEQKFKYNFYGYIAYQAYMDTYESRIARGGELYFYPKRPDYSPITGKDLNNNFQTNMLTLQSRLGTRISGPNISNVKTAALVEADFFGTADDYQYLFRLRHAYFTLKWRKLSLLMGHYWHPLFTPECAPDVIGFGAAPAYNPLNRSSQIRTDYIINSKIKLIGTLSMYSYHRPVGPESSQRNSGVPDIQLQSHFNVGKILLGFGGGYMQLQPREAAQEYKNSAEVHAFDAILFVNADLGNLTIKAKTVIGQNLTYANLIGGYGRIFDDMTNDTTFRYTALITNANWIDFEYKFNENLIFGLFYGFTQNLGALKKITKTNNPYFYDRNSDIAYIMKISPRMLYSINKLVFAVEYSYDRALYATEFDEYYKPRTTNLLISQNHRVLFSAKYHFN